MASLPGVWAGKAAEALGLSGKSAAMTLRARPAPETMRALFHYGIVPDGEPLGTASGARKYQARAAYAAVEEAISKRIAALGRFVTPGGEAGDPPAGAGEDAGAARPTTT